jgi:hypothetical protein
MKLNNYLLYLKYNKMYNHLFLLLSFPGTSKYNLKYGNNNVLINLKKTNNL